MAPTAASIAVTLSTFPSSSALVPIIAVGGIPRTPVNQGTEASKACQEKGVRRNTHSSSLPVETLNSVRRPLAF
jgi:hypothetical protein